MKLLITKVLLFFVALICLFNLACSEERCNQGVCMKASLKSGIAFESDAGCLEACIPCAKSKCENPTLIACPGDTVFICFAGLNVAEFQLNPIGTVKPTFNVKMKIFDDNDVVYSGRAYYVVEHGTTLKLSAKDGCASPVEIKIEVVEPGTVISYNCPPLQPLGSLYFFELFGDILSENLGVYSIKFNWDKLPYSQCDEIKVETLKYGIKGCKGIFNTAFTPNNVLKKDIKYKVISLPESGSFPKAIGQWFFNVDRSKNCHIPDDNKPQFIFELACSSDCYNSANLEKE